MKQQYRCRFLYLCTGYYRYDNGYTPEFAGRESFRGPIVHPQSWPDDLDHEGKRVVVIGSGATAVTMVPALSQRAAHVTMLQRSPSYVASLPAVDSSTLKLRQAIPEPWANRLVRWRNVLLTTGFYQLCRRRPEQAKRILRSAAARQLPPGYPVDPDFTPRYNPWDQRMCVAPNGDLFHAIKSGRASVVTDRIDTFTPDGIRLQSGRELDADIIVTATGLRLLPCGGIRLKVDGRPIEPSDTRIYRGFMLSDVPNLAICFGYINASWTLRADLTSRSVCRLINLMDRRGQVQAVPRYRESSGSVRPLLDLSSGYVQRGAPIMPKQGRGAPWKLQQNYLLDLLSARLGDMTRGLELSGPIAESRSSRASTTESVPYPR
jgi:cation diffusion facilitator CzcD-associated flavoprotein CzcO